MKIKCLSVVMATYNRAATLQETLSHIQKCRKPADVDVQILIVDNNSSDETRKVIEGFADGHPLKVEYMFEGKQGASAARNLALASARGDVICILDDDIIPHVDFLCQVRDEYERLDCRGVIGGRIELWNKNHLPFALQRGLAERVMTMTDYPSGFVAGGNLTAHRDVFERIGGFDEALGPGCAIGAAAEDADFSYRALKGGHAVRYSPNIITYHNHGRVNKDQIKRLFRSYFIGNGALFAKYISRGDRNMLRMFYWELRGIFKKKMDEDQAKLRRRIRKTKYWYYLLGAIRYLNLPVDERRQY